VIKDDWQVMLVLGGKFWTNGKEYTVIEVWKLPEGMYTASSPKRKSR
jgi:hypothetical protein